MQPVKLTYHGTRTDFHASEFGKSNVSVFSVQHQEQNPTQTIHHQILLVDLSYSMNWALRNPNLLAEHVLNWLSSLDANTYASVIAYSGHGESKQVITGVQCNPISLKMAKVEETIRAAFAPIGVTVMSEPLEKSLEQVKAVADICDVHSVVLFTDGCLVPNQWSVKVEKEKCFKVAEICRDQGIHLHAIGYGHYYDREFLEELINVAGNGVVIHSEDLKDFEQQVRDISYSTGRMIPVDLSIVFGAGEMTKVINASTAITYNADVASTSGIVIKSLPRSGKIYFGVLHTSNDVPKAIINGVEHVDDRRMEDIEGFDDVIYALAANYIKQGAIDEAEFVIRQLGDVALADKLTNAYSFKESGEALQQVTLALMNPENRFLQGRKPASPPKPEGISILEILQDLTLTEGAGLYWKVNTPYKSIGRRVQDVEDSIKFIRDEDAIVKVNDIIVSSDKLNLGIKVTIPGKSVDTVTGISRNCVTFRDRNIVHGGNLNVPYLHAKLTPELFDKYSAAGLLDHDSYDADRTYQINLEGLKMISKRFIRSMTPQEIVDELYQVRVLKTRQWALGQIRKEVVDETAPFQPAELPFEEQEIRNKLRIDFKGVYKPLEVEEVIPETVEVYPATFVEWDIAKFPEKAHKDTSLREVQAELTDKGWEVGRDNDKIFEWVEEQLTAIRRLIRGKMMRISFVRIASTIARRPVFVWETQEVKDKKSTSKITGQNLVIGGTCTKSMVTFGQTTLVETRWMELIEV